MDRDSPNSDGRVSGRAFNAVVNTIAGRLILAGVIFGSGSTVGTKFGRVDPFTGTEGAALTLRISDLEKVVTDHEREADMWKHKIIRCEANHRNLERRVERIEDTGGH